MICSIESRKDYNKTKNPVKVLCLICIPEGSSSPLTIHKQDYDMRISLLLQKLYLLLCVSVLDYRQE